METLHILNFNNYFNRHLKVLNNKDDIRSYEPFLVRNRLNPAYRCNFNPNDGVDASAIVNWEEDGSKIGNYLIVTDEVGEIISRWFIIDSVRTRLGQYNLSLHRDVLLDNLNNVLASDAFIERAMVSVENSAIYNSEGMNFSQIKTAEFDLHDNTGCPWLVAYLPRNIYTEGKVDINIGGKLQNFDEELNTLSNYRYYQYTTSASSKQYNVYKEFCSIVFSRYKPSNTVRKLVGFGGEAIGDGVGNTVDLRYPASTDAQPDFDLQRYQKKYGLEYLPGTGDYLSYDTQGIGGTKSYIGANNAIGGPVVGFTENIKKEVDKVYGYNTAPADKIKQDLGKIFKDKSTGKVYKLTEKKVKDSDYVRNQYHKKDTPIWNIFNKLVDRRFITGEGGNYNYWNGWTGYTTQYEFVEVYEKPLVLTLPQEHPKVLDAPYDMICAPYGVINVLHENGEVAFTTDKEDMLTLFTTISSQIGEQSVMDVQLLPYCPINNLKMIGNTIKKSNLPNAIFVKDTAGKDTSFIMWVLRTKFETTISVKVKLPDIASIAEEKEIAGKVLIETRKFRLVGPGYQGIFEYSYEKTRNKPTDPAISGDEADVSFTADCTYQPFNPFICVRPSYQAGSLYSKNYEDNRGLICQGDFSLPKLTDAYANYQQNNKTYEQMFAREMTNMEVNHNIGMAKSIIGGIGATVGGAIGGGMKGGIGGAVAGGAGALLGGALNVGMNQIGYNEAVDFKQDMFDYNIQNIQALPQNISKSTPLNNINRGVPILEVYDATLFEVGSFAKKIRLRGMAINAIGRVSFYLNNNYISTKLPYFKGKLIQYAGDEEDFHMTMAIASELNQGVYYDTE